MEQLPQFEELEPQRPPQVEEIEEGEIISLADPEEVKDFIKERFTKGERPIVSIKPQYLDTVLSKGLRPHKTWIPGVDIVAGTFGRPPFLPQEREPRVLLRLNIDDPSVMLPRFTGPDQRFHGIVGISGPIPPEQIEVVGSGGEAVQGFAA